MEPSRSHWFRSPLFSHVAPSDLISFHLILLIPSDVIPSDVIPSDVISSISSHFLLAHRVLCSIRPCPVASPSFSPSPPCPFLARPLHAPRTWIVGLLESFHEFPQPGEPDPALAGSFRGLRPAFAVLVPNHLFEPVQCLLPLRDERDLCVTRLEILLEIA